MYFSRIDGNGSSQLKESAGINTNKEYPNNASNDVKQVIFEDTPSSGDVLFLDNIQMYGSFHILSVYFFVR
jgi:hypothetical protein